MKNSSRRVLERTAGLGAIATAAAVIAYVIFLALVGAPWTEVPESPSGTPAAGANVLIPTPIEPVLIAFSASSLTVVGIIARLRGHLWGLYLAAVDALGLTIFGAIFIFGSFGLTFIAGVALLGFIAVFAWFGRATGPEMG